MTDIPEMVERVARKLCERCGVHPDDMDGGVWDGGSYAKGRPAWNCWVDDATAAIEVMREPTDQQRQLYYELSFRTEVMNDGCWERAIDAALGRKE